MNKRRMIGIFLFLAVGIMGAAGIFFVLNKGKATTDVFANMGISANPSAVNLEMEIEKSSDPALTNPFYIVETGNQTTTFNVNVSGLPKTASTMIYANSLSPEVAFAEVVGVPDEKGNSTVRVTARNGGTAQIKITSASGQRVIYVTVNVKLEAKGIRLNQGVHNAIVKKNGATAVLTFDEAKFTYLSHPDDVNGIYRANAHTAEYTWSPLNADKGISPNASIRVVNNTLEVDANAPEDREVWVRSTITKTGRYADFPVYIFKPFTPVNAIKTYDGKTYPDLPLEIDEESVPNDDGRYAEYGSFSVLDLIHNRADEHEEKLLADYAFSMPGWNVMNTNYGITAHSENEMVVTSELLPSATGQNVGKYRFDVNNVLGKTTLNIIAYPIGEMSILYGGVFVKEKTLFNWADDTVVQKKVSMPAYNRNEFRREDEPLNDGKMYFERDGERLYYVNRDINKNGEPDNGENWFDSRDINRNGEHDMGEEPFDLATARLVPDNGKVIYAFAYPSAAPVFPEQYYTEFKIGTVDIPVNAVDDVITNDVVFEVLFKQRGASGDPNIHSGNPLNTFLNIRANGVPISRLGNHAPYTSTFTIAVTQVGVSAGWVSPNAQLWLRVKSYQALSEGYYSNPDNLGDENGNNVFDNTYAIAEIGLSATNAIDDFFIKKLPEVPTSVYDAAQGSNMDTIALIIPDDDRDDPNDDYSKNRTPEFVVYGSSFVDYGNPSLGEWELDAEKVKIDTFGAPIKPLNGGRQVKVGKINGVNNAGYGYYMPGGTKYISDIYENFDKNGNGVEDDGENWGWTYVWEGGVNNSSGSYSYDGSDLLHPRQSNNVIDHFITSENRVTGENRRTNLVEYVFAVDLTQPFELYKEYPVRFTYPNGVYHEVKVIIYPYVGAMSMNMKSSGGGYVYSYKDYKIDGVDISRTERDRPETSQQNMDKPNRDTQPFGHWSKDPVTLATSPVRDAAKHLYASASYVRVGANYGLSLNTLTKDGARAEVGARAVFSDMRISVDGATYTPYNDGNGKSTFEALHEGEYEARVTLTAANDDVFRRFTYDWTDNNGMPGFQKEGTPTGVIGPNGEEKVTPADDWTWSGFRRSWYIKIIVVNPIISAEFTANDLQLTAARTLGVGEMGKAQQEMGVQMTFTYPAEEEYGTMNHVFLQVNADDVVAIIGLNEAVNKVINPENSSRAESRFVVEGQYETDSTARLKFHLRQEFRVVGEVLPPWDLNYLNNAEMELRVDIIYGNPVEEVIIVNGSYSSDAVSTDGTYIGLYLEEGMPMPDVAIGANVFPELADNSQISFTFAEWVNGKWELGYSYNASKQSYQVGYSVPGDGGAKNKERNGAPIADIVSIDISKKLAMLRAKGHNNVIERDTQIGLVAYALDSLRRVSVVVNGQTVYYDKPLTYSVIPVFVAPTDVVFGDLAKSFFEMVHDANSGVKNTRGGYNWVIKAENKSGTQENESLSHAALFYTALKAGSAPGQSIVTANKYFIDDLYTVLGYDHTDGNSTRNGQWTGLNSANRTEYPSDDPTIFGSRLRIANAIPANCVDITYWGERHNRPFITVKSIGSFTLTYGSSGDSYYKVIGHFTIVPGLSTINISTGGKGKLARQTLDSSLQNTNYEYDRSFTVRRGSPFTLTTSDWPAGSGWSATIHGKSYTIPDGVTKVYEDPPTFPRPGNPALYIGDPINTTRYPMDLNRDLFVVPFFMDDTNGLIYRVSELKSVIPVTLVKGAKYLEVSQRENTIDGHTAAVYDVTVITDEEIWRNDLLRYEFTGATYGSSSQSAALFPNNGSLGPNTTKVPLRDGESNETGAYLVFTLTRNESVMIDPATDPEGLTFYKHRISIKISIIVDVSLMNAVYNENTEKYETENPIFNIDNGILAITESVSSVDQQFHAPLSATATFNVASEYVYNVQFEHFANVTTMDVSELKMDESQSGNREIYADSNGGLLKVFTTPYYVPVGSFTIDSAKYDNKIVTGYDKNGEPITKNEPWRVHFIQYVYDVQKGTYVQFRLPEGSNTGAQPAIQMVSTYLGSSADGRDSYGWDGVYYFKTVVQQEFQGKASGLPPVGTKFPVTAIITTNGKEVRQSTVLTVAYPPSVEVTGPTLPDPLGVATIVRDEYQAIGTTKKYSIILPTGMTPYFEDMEVINGNYCVYDPVWTQGSNECVLTVALYGTEEAIGMTIGFRIPYVQSGGGGLAIQYYLLKVTPVYFELSKMFYVQGHRESPLLVDDTETAIELRVEVVRMDDRTVEPLNTIITNEITNFETQLNSSILVSWWGANGYNGTYRSLLLPTYDDLVFTFINEFGVKSVTRNTAYTPPSGNVTAGDYGSYLRAMITFSYAAGVPLLETNGRLLLESNQWIVDSKEWTRINKGTLSEEEWLAIFRGGDYEVDEDGKITVNSPGSGVSTWDSVTEYEYSGGKSLSLKENMAIGTTNSFRIGDNPMEFHNARAYWYIFPEGDTAISPVGATSSPTPTANNMIELIYDVSSLSSDEDPVTKIIYEYDGIALTWRVKVNLPIEVPLDRVLRVEIPYKVAKTVGGEEVTRWFKLDIVPVLFTFDGYRLDNSPDDPKKLMLGWPVQIVLQADNIVRAPLPTEAILDLPAGLVKDRYNAIAREIDRFNTSLKGTYGEQPIEYFAYRGVNRVVLSDDGIVNGTLNYKFYVTDGKVYIEKSKDITASSYFGVSTRIEYRTSGINIGAPFLSGEYNRNNEWKDTSATLITVIMHSWRVETEASIPQPPPFPEPGYSVQFGMVVPETTKPINNDGSGELPTELLVLSDNGDWEKYTGQEPTLTQITSFGGLSLVPDDPIHPNNLYNQRYPDEEPPKPEYEFVGWIPAYWYYTYDGNVYSTTPLTNAGKLIGREIRPLDQAMPLARAYDREYLESAYQISQNIIFMAVFRPADAERPVEPNDDPFDKYTENSTTYRALKIWRVNFWSIDESGETIMSTPEQWVVDGKYAIAPTDPAPIPAFGYTVWTGWYGPEPTTPELWPDRNANPLALDYEVNQSPVTRDIDYIATFNGIPVTGPVPMHTIHFMTFNPNADDGMPMLAFADADGQKYIRYVGNGKSPTQLPENPVYGNFAFVGWKLIMDSDYPKREQREDESDNDYKEYIKRLGGNYQAVLAANPDMPDGINTLLEFAVVGQNAVDGTDIIRMGYYKDKERANFQELRIYHQYNKLDIYLGAYFEYRPVADKGQTNAIALGTTKSYTLGGEKVRMAEMYVMYSTEDGTSPMDGRLDIENGNYTKIFNLGTDYVMSLSWMGAGNLLTVQMSMNPKVLGSVIEIRLPFTAMRNGIIRNDLYYYIRLIPVWFEVEEIIAVNDRGGEYLLPNVGENWVTSYSGEQLKLGIRTRSYNDYTSAQVPHKNESFMQNIRLEIDQFLQVLNSTNHTNVNNGTGLLSILPMDSGDEEGINIRYDGGATPHRNLIYRTVAEEFRARLQIVGNIKYIGGVPAVVAQSNVDELTLALFPKYYTMVTSNETEGKGNSPENPILIWKQNANDLLSMAAGSHYMLMEDIDLRKDTGLGDTGWQPLAFGSDGQNGGEKGAYTTLDGNNFKIFIRSDTFGAVSANTENVGVFSVINEGSVIKNLQVVVYDEEAGVKGLTNVEFDLTPITAEIKGGVKLGLLAGTNRGTITNCAVLSGGQFMTADDGSNRIIGGKDGTIADDTNGELKADYSKSAFLVDKASSPGRMIVKVNNSKLDLYVGGLVGSNEGSITNSRVMIDVELSAPIPVPKPGVVGTLIEYPNAKTAVVGGIAGKNSKLITATFFSDANVINQALVVGTGGVLGGFVGQNLSSGRIMASYVMGVSSPTITDPDTGTILFRGRDAGNKYVAPGATIWSDRNPVGAFVHQNLGTIEDCLANVILKKMGTDEVAGFVFTNTGDIANCIANNDFIRSTDISSQAQAFEFVQSNSDDTRIKNSKYFSNNDNMHPGDANQKVDTLQPDLFVSAGLPAAEMLSIYNVDNSKYKDFSMDGYITAAENALSPKTTQAYKNGIAASFNEINTVWRLTPLGPIPNSARYEIVYSMYNVDPENEAHWRNPTAPLHSNVGGYTPKGRRTNPLLVSSEGEYTKYLSGEDFVITGAIQDTVISQSSIRLINDITFTATPTTYNLIYQSGSADAVFDGNGFVLSKVSNVNTATAGTMSSTGLFAKTVGATFKNLGIKIAKPMGVGSGAAIDAHSYNYVGGLAGIAIDTNLIDIEVASETASDEIVGGHIVGGLVGVMIATPHKEEHQEDIRIFNVTAKTALHSRWHFGSVATTDKMFNTGREYYEGRGVDNGRKEDDREGRDGKYVFTQTYYDKRTDAGHAGEAIGMGIVGNLFGVLTSAPRYSQLESFMFDDINSDKIPTYQTIRVQKAVGEALSLRGDIAGGLIGVMDRRTEINSVNISGLGSITGKYYLGGMVGINLGTIQNSLVNITNFNANTDATGGGGKYVYQNRQEVGGQDFMYWGITIGGVAGYNNGSIINVDSTARMGGRNAANIYVVGGIVGQNDTKKLSGSSEKRGVVGNDCSSSSLIDVTTVGFYFGDIIGRVADTGGGDSVAVWESPVERSPVTSAHFYGATLKGPNGEVIYPLFTSAAARHNNGVITPSITTGGKDGTMYSSDTMKIQTYTLKEYLLYINKSKSAWSISELADKLEPLVRGLPRTKRAMTDYGLETYSFSTFVDKGGAEELGDPTGPEIKLDLEHFDMEEMKKWLLGKNIFRDVTQAGYQRVRYNAYMHYLDDNMYSHYTVPVKNDFYDKTLVTGYNIGANYGSEAITLDEFKYFADELYGKTASPISNAVFTMTDYTEYLKYKLAMGVDYMGMKTVNGVSGKNGLALRDYIQWDSFGHSYTEGKGGFYSNGISGRKVNGKVDWYWPVSATPLYYGHTLVRNNSGSYDWTMVAGTVNNMNGRMWIAGTGFNASEGYAYDRVPANLIVDNKGREISPLGDIEGSYRADIEHVHDYFKFLEARSINKDLEGYFTLNSNGENGSSAKTGITFYAAWLYDDFNMTLAEYIYYLQNNKLTQEDVAYLLAFGDTPNTLTDFKLSMAQYRTMTEYETAALGYELRWWFTGTPSGGSEWLEKPRGVGVTEAEIKDFYDLAALPLNKVYLYFGDTLRGSPGVGNAPNPIDMNTAVLDENEEHVYIWKNVINNNGSDKWWFYDKNDDTVLYPTFSSLYGNTVTVAAVPPSAPGVEPSSPGVVAVKITFEEYLQIYSTRPDGLKNMDPEGTKPRKGDPQYTNDYTMGAGKDLITANEDYIKLVKFGEYDGGGRIASLWDYRQGGSNADNFVTSGGIAGVNTNPRNFSNYIFGISVYQYGWDEPTANFIFDNLEGSLEWGVVGTFASVYIDKKTFGSTEVSQPQSIIADTPFNDTDTVKDSTLDGAGNWPEFAYMVPDKKNGGYKNGRMNDIRPLTLHMENAIDDHFTPNISDFPGLSAEEIVLYGSGPDNTAIDTILALAWFWKQKGFSPMQFEEMKNKVIFVNGTYNEGEDDEIEYNFDAIKNRTVPTYDDDNDSTTPEIPIQSFVGEDKWTWKLLLSDHNGFALAFEDDFGTGDFMDILKRGSYSEYTQFINGANGLDGPEVAVTDRLNTETKNLQTRAYTTSKFEYEIRTFGESKVTETIWNANYYTGSNVTKNERISDNADITTLYRNPLGGIKAPRAYLMMLRADGSIKDYKTKMGIVTTDNYNEYFYSSVNIYGKTMANVVKPTDGSYANDKFDLNTYYISNTNSLSLPDLKSNNAGVWVGFVPSQSDRYTITISKYNYYANYHNHPYFTLYRVDTDNRIISVADGSGYESIGGEFQLAANTRYLLRVYTTCVNENYISNKTKYAVTVTPKNNVNEPFISSSGIVGTRSTETHIESSSMSYSGTFPTIAFYVDYMRRLKEADDQFITGEEYMNAVDRDNLYPIFDQYADNADKKEEIDGTGYAPEIAKLPEIMGLTEAVDAMVNWLMFNKSHPGYSQLGMMNKGHGVQGRTDYGRKFLYDTGIYKESTYISYYDYIDWLVNYVNPPDDSDLREARQTWLTFEAFCVWKRMESWDKYYRGKFAVGGGNLTDAYNTFFLNKTRFGLDLNPLFGQGQRGIYLYYVNNGGSSFYYPWWDPYRPEYSGSAYPDAKNNLNRSNGYVFQRGVTSSNMYSGIQGGQIFDEYIPYVGRVVPYSKSYDYLHIEYESTGASFYYNGLPILEQTASTDYYLVTYVNPSLEQFLASTKERWDVLCTTTNGQVTDSSAYDKYMYYWATHSDKLGTITTLGNVEESTTPTGLDNFWKNVYGSVDYDNSNYINPENPSSHRVTIDAQTRKYMPLYQRMDPPEGDDAVNVGGEVMLITHW